MQFLELLKVAIVINTSTSTSTSTLGGPVIPPLEPVTVIYLAELLKDVLNTVKAISGAIDTFKATKPQATDSSQP